MNSVELFVVITTLGCPVAAGVAAASQKAGWFTVIFIVAGLIVGVAVGWAVNKFAYWMLHIGAHEKRPLVGCLLLVAYMFVLTFLVFTAIGGTAWITVWAAKGIF